MYLRLFSVEDHFGVFRCTCLKIACNSKTAGCRVCVTDSYFGQRGSCDHGDTCNV